MPNDETPQAKTERLEDEAREEDVAGQSDDKFAKEREDEGESESAAFWRKTAKGHFTEAAKQYEEAAIRREGQAESADHSKDWCRAGDEYAQQGYDYLHASRIRAALGDRAEAARLQGLAEEAFEKAGDRLKLCAERRIEQGDLNRGTRVRLTRAVECFELAKKDKKAEQCRKLLELVRKVLEDLQKDKDLLDERTTPPDKPSFAAESERGTKEECNCKIVSVDDDPNKKTDWQCRCFRLTNPNRKLSSFKGPGFTNWVGGNGGGTSSAGNLTERVIDPESGEAFVVEYTCKCHDELLVADRPRDQI